MLIEALEEITNDKGFQQPSSLAVAALEAAKNILTWQGDPVIITILISLQMPCMPSCRNPSNCLVGNSIEGKRKCRGVTTPFGALKSL